MKKNKLKTLKVVELFNKKAKLNSVIKSKRHKKTLASVQKIKESLDHIALKYKKVLDKVYSIQIKKCT